MNVAQLMTSHVLAVSEFDSLNSAARIMWEHDCGCVPVLNPDLKVVGILTDRDICMASYTKGENLHTVPVQAAMAKKIVSCGPEDDISVAMNLMRKNQVRRVMVRDSTGAIAGVVSVSDIARAAEREVRENLPREISDIDLARVMGALAQPHPRAIPKVAAEKAPRRKRAAAPKAAPRRKATRAASTPAPNPDGAKPRE